MITLIWHFAASGYADDRASMFSEPRAPTLDNTSVSSSQSSKSSRSSQGSSAPCPVGTTVADLQPPPLKGMLYYSVISSPTTSTKRYAIII